MDYFLIGYFSDFSTLMAGIYFASYGIQAIKELFVQKINQIQNKQKEFDDYLDFINTTASGIPFEITRECGLHAVVDKLDKKRRKLKKKAEKSAEDIVDGYQKIYLISGIFCIALVLFSALENAHIISLDEYILHIKNGSTTIASRVYKPFLFSVFLYACTLVFVVTVETSNKAKDRWKTLKNRTCSIFKIETGFSSTSSFRFLLFAIAQIAIVLSPLFISFSFYELSHISFAIILITFTLAGLILVFLHFFFKIYFDSRLIFRTREIKDESQKRLESALLRVVSTR